MKPSTLIKSMGLAALVFSAIELANFLKEESKSSQNYSAIAEKKAQNYGLSSAYLAILGLGALYISGDVRKHPEADDWRR